MWLSLIWTKVKLPSPGLSAPGWPKVSRRQDAAADGPEDPGADPGHALEEAAAVDAVVVVIVNDFVCHMDE